MSGVFCTNNAQAPSQGCLIYHLTEEGHCCPKLFQHTIVCLLVLRWKRGRELVHCLYKKTPDLFLEAEKIPAIIFREPTY